MLKKKKQVKTPVASRDAGAGNAPYKAQIAINLADILNFIEFPQKIYPDGAVNPCDPRFEEALLEHRFRATDGWDIIPLIVHSKGKIASRCACFLPPESRDLFFGLFDCVNDEDICALTMAKVEETARERGRSRVLGPIDGSPWYGFRMKTAGFGNSPYIGERLNPPYYPRLLESTGFSPASIYRTSYIDAPLSSTDACDEYCVKRLARAQSRGYRFEHPNSVSWSSSVEQMLRLFKKTNAKKGIFAGMDVEDAKEVFDGMKSLVDYSLIYLVYPFDSIELCAFMVVVPDYGEDSLGETTQGKAVSCLARALFGRHDRYRLLCLCAHPKHSVLNGALTQLLYEDMLSRQSALVRSYTREATTHNIWFKTKERASSEYALYAKDVEPQEPQR